MCVSLCVFFVYSLPPAADDHPLLTIQFVVNGYPPYELHGDNHGVDKMRWFEALAANLGSKSAPVHRTAAYVIGMALKHYAIELAETDVCAFIEMRECCAVGMELGSFVI